LVFRGKARWSDVPGILRGELPLEIGVIFHVEDWFPPSVPGGQTPRDQLPFERAFVRSGVEMTFQVSKAFIGSGDSPVMLCAVNGVTFFPRARENLVAPPSVRGMVATYIQFGDARTRRRAGTLPVIRSEEFAEY
jgi:hypothetical protein